MCPSMCAAQALFKAPENGPGGRERLQTSCSLMPLEKTVDSYRLPASGRMTGQGPSFQYLIV